MVRGVGYGRVAEEDGGGGGGDGRMCAVQDAGRGAASGDEWKMWVHAVAARRCEIARGVH